MFNWLKDLFHICKHEYELIHKYKLFQTKYPYKTRGIQYISSCKKCGKVKISKKLDINELL